MSQEKFSLVEEFVHEQIQGENINYHLFLQPWYVHKEF